MRKSVDDLLRKGTGAFQLNSIRLAFGGGPDLPQLLQYRIIALLSESDEIRGDFPLTIKYPHDVRFRNGFFTSFNPQREIFKSVWNSMGDEQGHRFILTVGIHEILSLISRAEDLNRKADKQQVIGIHIVYVGELHEFLLKRDRLINRLSDLFCVPGLGKISN